MNVQRWLLAWSVAGSCLGFSCGDPQGPSPVEQPAPTAGGTTEDFGGSEVPCERDELVELDRQSELGYSPREVLDLIEGRYAFPLRWSDPCSPDTECAFREPCAQLSRTRTVPRVAGTATTMMLEVKATSERAHTALPGEGQVTCARQMHVPVEVSIESADGAFALHIDAEVATYTGRYSEFAYAGPDLLGEATGTLPSELPDGATLELGFGAGDDDTWDFGIFLLQGPHSRPPLLRGALPGGNCAGEGLRRSDYLLP